MLFISAYFLFLTQSLASHRYATHFVGKWDAGMATPTHTPQGRGYDTSLNYFEHKNDYWTQVGMQVRDKYFLPHRLSVT